VYPSVCRWLANSVEGCSEKGMQLLQTVKKVFLQLSCPVLLPELLRLLPPPADRVSSTRAEGKERGSKREEGGMRKGK